jgi:hypothetical protein
MTSCKQTNNPTVVNEACDVEQTAEHTCFHSARPLRDPSFGYPKACNEVFDSVLILPALRLYPPLDPNGCSVLARTEVQPEGGRGNDSVAWVVLPSHHNGLGYTLQVRASQDTT